VWDAAGLFAPTLDPARPSFSIQLPPPNVTGTLHMGHAFNQTIMDALTRYHRMRGHNTLWVPGTDHAGIATQIVVERQLQDAGPVAPRPGPQELRRPGVGLEGQSGATITRQMRRMGDSVDWSREYFTMDDKLSGVVTETFVRLFDEGLIYRGKRLVSWDPVLKSAVSDLEVESEEEDGFLWHIRYPLADGSGDVVVATTRPETMLGDTAVMVHPEDERYTALGRPAGEAAAVRPPDPGHRRRLRRPRIRHRRGQGHAGARRQRLRRGPAPRPADDRRAGAGREDQRPGPAAYQGLDRFVARKKVVADLDALGLLVETKKHRLMVPRCARTGQVIEPMLTDQWFVAMNKAGAGGKSIAAAGHRGRRQRPGALRARAMGQHLQPLDEQHPGLVHQPPAVVGPPDPGLVRHGRRTVRGAQRRRGPPTCDTSRLQRPADTRRGRARHLVQLGPGALQPRWAGRPRPSSRTCSCPAPCS
jgi:valyl-tRNA synthetase